MDRDGPRAALVSLIDTASQPLRVTVVQAAETARAQHRRAAVREPRGGRGADAARRARDDDPQPAHGRVRVVGGRVLRLGVDEATAGRRRRVAAFGERRRRRRRQLERCRRDVRRARREQPPAQRCGASGHSTSSTASNCHTGVAHERPPQRRRGRGRHRHRRARCVIGVRGGRQPKQVRCRAARAELARCRAHEALERVGARGCLELARQAACRRGGGRRAPAAAARAVVVVRRRRRGGGRLIVSGGVRGGAAEQDKPRARRRLRGAPARDDLMTTMTRRRMRRMSARRPARRLDESVRRERE